MNPLPLLIVAAVGAFLVARGWRGRLLDDHPLCRRCGFDLFGLPAGSIVCSECGADLDKPRAIVVGHRQRRPGFILLGAAMVLLSIWFPVRRAVDDVREAGLIACEPVWVLRWQANRASTPTTQRSQVLAELLGRLRIRELSDSQILAIADQGLRIQADPAQPWLREWGDFIETAHREGKLDDARWRQYARNLCTFAMRVRPRVRRGDPLPILITADETRGSADHVGQLIVQVAPSIELAPWVPMSREHSFRRTGSTTGQRFELPLALDSDGLRDTPDGTQVLRAVAHVRVHQWNGGETASFVEFDVPLSAEWTLVPESEPTVAPVNDENLRAAMRASVFVSQPRVFYFGRMLSVDWRIGRPPVPIAAELILRIGDREFLLDSVAMDRADSGYMSYFKELPNLPSGSAELVLRPSQRVAIESLSITQFWNEEIVVRDLPVTHQ